MRRTTAARAFGLPQRATAVLLAAVLLASCTPTTPSLQRIRKRGELRVVTVNSPTTYYLGAHGAQGLEFKLARDFAAQLGVGLYMYPVANIRAMRAEIAAGRADIAAAQLTADASWRLVGRAAKVYERIPQLVVYRRGGTRPRSVLQLESARLSVRAGSPQEELLKKLKGTVAPNLHWIETAPRAADPLEDVQNGEADYAIIDAREFSFSHHLYPDIRVGFTLTDKRPVQWIVRKGDPDLYAAVNRFFGSVTQSGQLARIEKSSSGDASHFKYLQSRRFQENILARLPLYRSLFEQASAQSGVDWRLLAAMSYQESKWLPDAQSPTGARGMMMLTSTTAHALGVSNRDDPRQNILAGAKYLVKVRDMIPARIPEPDRTWMALAAYNVGWGHLEDARIITQMRGKNPDSWKDVSSSLPLLASPRWYTRVKRGYARGWQPVQYVHRIQQFLKLLEWNTTETVAGHQGTYVAPEA